MGELDGVVAVITGAAGGIGREHARLFTAQGAAVVVNDICDTSALVDELIAAGGRAVGFTGDISTWTGAHGAIACAVDTFGDLHALVNNAGGGAQALAADLTEEAWDHEIALNLKGMFCPSRAALGYWQQRRAEGRSVSASIVNTTSGAGLLGNAGQSAYGAAKAGVAAFTVIAATELSGTGIRVNAVAPAARTEVAMASSPVIGQFMKAPDDPQAFDNWHPRNIAPLVAYLSTPSCPITGEVFHVRGGVVGHFQGWTIGGTMQLDRAITIADLRDRLPAIVAAAPSRAEAGGAAYSALRNAWRDDKTSPDKTGPDRAARG
ncbi:MAG: SDR family NAD(P)-dependent oxidoreductase [Acidimicrobiia bacterium]